MLTANTKVRAPLRRDHRRDHSLDLNVYSMRMARVNITVPDDLLDRARAAGLNVSRVATTALTEELDGLDKIAELDRYLRQLDAELGPISDEERRAAQEWADAALGSVALPNEDATRSA
jgi:post-segregation antitoxin (ccd killing protein)